MAYLSPSFEWDVFVSYSHGVQRSRGSSPLKRWSHALIEALKDDIHDLSTEFGDFAIWYDEDIDPTAKLTDELRGKVERAAILMILMSPRYLTSSWCTDERAW